MKRWNSLKLEPYFNQVEITDCNNRITLSDYQNQVEIELVTVETPYYFLTPFQPAIIKVV